MNCKLQTWPQGLGHVTFCGLPFPTKNLMLKVPNVFSSTSSPRDASPPIRFSGGFSKTRCTTDEMTRLAKQLPWDHPIARTLHHEVHRRKMAGKSCRFFHWQDWVASFPHTIFFFGLRWCFPISTFFGPSTFALDDLDCFGSQTVRVDFFVTDSLDSVEDKPVCHIYQWIAHPTHGSLCNHCDRWWMGTL